MYACLPFSMTSSMQPRKFSAVAVLEGAVVPPTSRVPGVMGNGEGAGVLTELPSTVRVRL